MPATPVTLPFEVWEWYGKLTGDSTRGPSKSPHQQGTWICFLGWFFTDSVDSTMATHYEKSLHPQKFTWNLEMMVSNRNLLSKGPFSGSMFVLGGVFGKILVLLIPTNFN